MALDAMHWPGILRAMSRPALRLHDFSSLPTSHVRMMDGHACLIRENSMNLGSVE